MRYLVLLKDGRFDIVSCPADDVFAVARARGAGICGAFDEMNQADLFKAEIAEELRRSSAWSKPHLVWSARPAAEMADSQSKRTASLFSDTSTGNAA